MTQTLETAYGRYLADFQTVERDVRAQQPGWLDELREAAFEHFREAGLPTARRGNEPWKYTNVGPIANSEFAYGAAPAPGLDASSLAAVAPWCTVWHDLVFVNGRYSPELSSHRPTIEPKGGLKGAVISSLAEGLALRGDLVRRHLGEYARYDYDGFAALNTAFLRDGAFVYVPDGQEISAHIHLLFVSTSQSPSVSYPRTLIVAGPNSKVTIIETYVSLSGGNFNDAVTEIALEEGASVEHHRVLLDRDAYHVGLTRVRQGRDSRFRSTAFSTGPALARNDFSVLMDGPGADCRLRGLYVTAGRQHIDNYLTIDHAQPHCTSRLYYKGILDERSRAVFGGTVFVRPGANKTDAHQEDKNLLLSAEAEVDSKPSLEIYADDVKCGHGATAGAVAEEALFYMQSRGLDAETAQEFLVKGFASEILDDVMEPLREYLEKATTAALPRFQRGENGA